MDLGKALRAVRLELGQSQRAAAVMVGVSHVHLNNIENGRASPTLTMLEKFRAAWGVDLYLYAAAMRADLPEYLAARLMRHVSQTVADAKRKQKTK